MKNKQAVKEIVRIADKLDRINVKTAQLCAFKGYELANLLCNRWKKDLTQIEGLMFAKWLFWANELCEELEVNKYL